MKEKQLTNLKKSKSSSKNTSSAAQQLQKAKETKIVNSRPKSKTKSDDSLNYNISSIIPSTSIVNSTAIQSDRAMMVNKQQFSGDCKNVIKTQPALNVEENNKRLPIIIYCPLKSLKNKIVDENNKILITKDEIESKIGKEYMECYFGKHEPKIRCNAHNQLLFIPPKQIKIDENLIKIKGKIVEKGKKII